VALKEGEKQQKPRKKKKRRRKRKKERKGRVAVQSPVAQCILDLSVQVSIKRREKGGGIHQWGEEEHKNFYFRFRGGGESRKAYCFDGRDQQKKKKKKTEKRRGEWVEAKKAIRMGQRTPPGAVLEFEGGFKKEEGGDSANEKGRVGLSALESRTG